MSGKFFLDTNILVYSKDTNYPEKQKIAESLLMEAFETGFGIVSLQVLNEFYVTVTKKLNPGLNTSEARELVKSLSLLCPEFETNEILHMAWVMEDTYSLSYWDALVTASASLQHCEILYSEDMQNGLKINNMTIIDPFSAPAKPIS